MAGIDEDANHLSNEQMVALLRDAEQRLRTKQSTTELKRNASVPNKSMRLSEHNLPKPYVSTQSGFAKLDPSWVRSGEDYKLAGRVLKVEDPVVVKERKLEVGYSLSISKSMFSAHEEDLSQDSSLRRTSQARYGYCSAVMRVILHSYSEAIYSIVAKRQPECAPMTKNLSLIGEKSHGRAPVVQSPSHRSHP